MKSFKQAAAWSGAALLACCVLTPALAAVQVPQAAELSQADRQKLIELGKKYKSSWDLYQALKKEANGGQKMTWQNLPNWEGVYTRTKGGTAFDPDGPEQGKPPSAKFTPEYHAKMVKDVENRARGIEYDPLSQCVAPTYPRWLDLPFLRDYAVTPNQTWMSAEAFNQTRRIYTDGREHPPVDERYPTELGDSIGFWDGQKLIVHTTMNMAHMYERAQGFYSDEVESVEIWHKADDRTIVADVWVYDPPALAEPWYTRQSYTRIDEPDRALRVRYWACKGNQNNDVIETPEGGSTFRDFTFTKSDDSKEKAK